MKKGLQLNRVLLISLAVIISLIALNPEADASTYRSSFKNASIEILSPNANGSEYEGIVNIQGTANLSKVWLALRGPNNEIVTYPVDIENNRFSIDIYLRFGPGTYTFWAGDNAKSFDGSIRFQVVNTVQEDNRYLAPSAYVDSNNPLIINLANTIIKPEMTAIEKVQAIHSWVTNNISYDYEVYQRGENRMVSASQTLRDGKGICRDYAMLTAALARAAGLEANVVYGEAKGSKGWDPQMHAWNEIKVDGRWVTLDTTWDAGYIQNSKFVRSPGTKFLNPDPVQLAATHTPTEYTLH